MKIIKFDLPINGVKAKNLEELRNNLTDEIVGLARSGQLARWFTSRQLEDKAKAVAAVLSGAPEDKALFLALCEILAVEAHPDDVNAIFDALPEAGYFLKDARYFELYQLSNNRIKELEDKIKGLDKVENSANSKKNTYRIPVKVPQLSESIAEGILVTFKYKIGDKIQADYNIIDVETDKVVLEVPSPATGILVDIIKESGSTVISEEIIAFIEVSN